MKNIIQYVSVNNIIYEGIYGNNIFRYIVNSKEKKNYFIYVIDYSHTFCCGCLDRLIKSKNF